MYQSLYNSTALFYTLIFGGGLFGVSWAIRGDKIYLMIAIAIALTLLSAHAVHIIGRRYLYLPLTILLTISAVLLFYLIDPPKLQYIFIIASMLVYYATLIGIVRMRHIGDDYLARGIYVAASMVAVFFAFTAVIGFHINFREVYHPLGIPITIEMSVGLLMAAFFAISAVTAYAYFYIITDNKSLAMLYSMVIGIGVAQFSWALHFWPFRYLTTGVIALMFYYILWDLAQSNFLNILSKKRVLANVVFFGIVTATLLITAQWDIVV